MMDEDEPTVGDEIEAIPIGDDWEIEQYGPLTPDQFGEDMDEDARALALARLPLNDIGNAERLRRLFGADLMDVDGIGLHVWDGRRWADEHNNGGEPAAVMIAHRAVAAIADQAKAADRRMAEADDADIQKRWKARSANLWKWVVASGNSSRVRAMIAEARPYLRVGIAAIDPDPLLLTVDNGTLDLSNPAEIRLRRHGRDYRMTKACRVSYDPDAKCPRFVEFVETILPDKDEREFVQRLLGYSMTGLTGEQKMALFVGRGANGKSTLLEIVATILGGYAATTPIETLLYGGNNKRGSEASPDLARLPGVRLLRTAEPETGSRLAESTIKTMTGGEAMAARKLQKDFFEFLPQFKIVLSCNRRPRIRGTDDGIRRRLMIVPFRVQIPPEKRDLGFAGKLLKSERSGILNWLIDGYQDWAEKGLAPPPEVTVATDEYFDEQDAVGRFLRECTVEAPGQSIDARRLYDGFCIWCRDNAIEPKSQTAFGLEMNNQDHRKKRSNRGFAFLDLAFVAWLADALASTSRDEGLPEDRG